MITKIGEEELYKLGGAFPMAVARELPTNALVNKASNAMSMAEKYRLRGWRAPETMKETLARHPEWAAIPRNRPISNFTGRVLI